uniref:Rab-GAP TBC domain-containing protein n=1 Tax=Meloidogyne hapla TaxID=6305 RepID=A0A1I8B929_MELHA
MNERSADPETCNAICDDQLKVVIFESTTERERQASITFDGDKERSPTRQMPTQLIHPANVSDSDSDEPLLSGSGEVCRDCSEDRLAAWNEMIDLWKQTPEQRPSGLNSLIHDGIPDVLRGEVWLLLARIGTVKADLVQAYQMLLEKECPSEAIILRDIHRTFPAHEYFTEENDKGGQKALYRISKAVIVSKISQIIKAFSILFMMMKLVIVKDYHFLQLRFFYMFIFILLHFKGLIADARRAGLLYASSHNVRLWNA